jgi:glycosyltransferase involved in cell wall biosynthesis
VDGLGHPIDTGCTILTKWRRPLRTRNGSRWGKDVENPPSTITSTSKSSKAQDESAKARPPDESSFSPLRILVISRSGLRFPNPPGGAENTALRQSIGLALIGVKVSLIGQGSLPPSCPKENLHLIDAEFSRDTHSRSRLAYYFKVFFFAAMAGLRGAQTIRRDRSIEVVHCHHAVTVVTARFLSRRVPMVYTVHDNPFQRKDSAGSMMELAIRVVNNLLLETWVAKRVDGLIAVSPEIRNRLVTRGIAWDAISVILPQAAGRTAERGEDEVIRAVTGLGIARPYILSVGDLTGRKRMDELVRAMTSLPPPLQLVIVGRGPLRASLEDLVTRLNLRGRIRVLDFVDDSTMDALQRAAVLSAIVSTREGFPTTLIEAARVGTPGLYCTAEQVALPETQPFVRHLITSRPEEIATALREMVDWATSPQYDRRRVSSWARGTFPDEVETARQLLAAYRGAIDRWH